MAQLYADSALAIASKIPGKDLFVRLHERIGLTYHGRGAFFTALNYYDKGAALGNQVKNKSILAAIYLNKSDIYHQVADYVKSIEANENALNIYTAINDVGGVASCYINLSITYIALNDFKTAYSYIQKALPIFENDDPKSRGVASAKDLMGNIILKASKEDLIAIGINPKEQLSKAIQLFQSAIVIADFIEDHALKAELLMGMGKAYEMQNNMQAAAQTYQLALVESNLGMESTTMSINSIKVGDFFIRQNQPERGVANLHTGLLLAKNSKLLVPQEDAAESLSKYFEQKGNYDSALYYFKQYELAKASIYDVEKEKELTRKKMALDFSIKEKEFTFQQRLTNQQLNEQLLLAKQKQQVIELQKQRQQIIEKENNLQKLAFLTKQAQLELQKNQQATILKEERLKFGYDKKISSNKIRAQETEINLKNTQALLLVISAIVFLGATIGFYRSRRKTMKLNKTIEAQKQSLEELVQVKDKVFSVVGHDMRTPINSLMSFVQLLEYGDLNKEQLALYAAELGNNLRFTSSLMENLLYWAGSQMQGFKPQLGLVNLQSIAETVIQNLSTTSEQKKIHIQHNLQNPVNVWADNDMLTVVLRNLLSNAIKYSYESGTINLTVSQTEAHVLIAISDEGTGLSEAKLLEINSEEATAIESSHGTKKEKGTGLGLLLCKNFIAMMQGKISAQNNQLKGSTFTITLNKQLI